VTQLLLIVKAIGLIFVIAVRRPALILAVAKHGDPWSICLKLHTAQWPDLTGQVRKLQIELESLQADLRWHKDRTRELELGHAVLRREHTNQIAALKIAHHNEIKGMRGVR